MFDPGLRTVRVMFRRNVRTVNALGNEVSALSDHQAAWCSVRYGSSAERREAAADQGSQVVTFRAPATAALRQIGVGDELVDPDGVVFGIHGIAKVGFPVGRELEFTATARVG